MSSEVLSEEFEVLESIYPTELTKLSEKEISIDVEPDDPIDGAEEELALVFTVEYTEDYPDTLPKFSLELKKGEVDEEDIKQLLGELEKVGEENIGMAMTFTLVSHLRERLSILMRMRVERIRKDEAERERRQLEAEEAKTRGTPVTLESFKAWKTKFEKETAAKRAREEDEKLKGLSAKDKEEYKRLQTRLSGRQLFERDKNLGALDEGLTEVDAISVDISHYDRATSDEDDDDDEDRVIFSDSE